MHDFFLGGLYNAASFQFSVHILGALLPVQVNILMTV